MHDLVQGNTGYVLKVGERAWFVEPQTELGESDGVAVPPRPDFLIRPARATEAPPVAAFKLTGPAGRVIAEAELAWPERKVVVLLSEQREWAALFAGAGWRVVEEGTESFVDVVVASLKA